MQVTRMWLAQLAWTGLAIVSWATSQDEADRNRGRKLRKQEAREAKERRREEKRRRKQEREWRDD